MTKQIELNEEVTLTFSVPISQSGKVSELLEGAHPWKGKWSLQTDDTNTCRFTIPFVVSWTDMGRLMDLLSKL